jgi:uncharacterized protein (DUF1810 family)/uncharacterized damage-inducible protein DinB
VDDPYDDPYDLARFVTAQDSGGTYARAVAELRAGAKTSHWMWFVFPQLAGLGRSDVSRRYAISSLDEARAYLRHGVLGPRLRECAGIVAASDRDAGDIFGGIDAMKLRSSMTLFLRAEPAEPVFAEVLRRHFGGVPDPETDRLAGIDEQGRPEPPLGVGEAETVMGFLEFHRATLAWKCAGLDADGLRARVGASAMTLGGMLKHLSYVEDYWCSYLLHGNDPRPPWDTVDWTATPDWDWDSAAADTPEQLRAMWRDAVDRSRTLVARALAGAGPDRLAVRAWSDGRRPSLRWILVHLVEEYSRHNGHADLLRESVDGATGE